MEDYKDAGRKKLRDFISKKFGQSDGFFSIKLIVLKTGNYIVYDESDGLK